MACEHIKELLDFLKKTNLIIFYEVYCPTCKTFFCFKEKEE